MKVGGIARTSGSGLSDELTIQTDLGGTLTFNFQTGDYTYIAPDKVQHGPPGSDTDTEVDEVFTYTIQDKDGDTDPANLVICIQDGVPTAADDVNLVQESALDLNKDGIDLVAGLVVGSNAASKAETVTGNLMGNDSEGPDGASITAIKFNGSENVGTPGTVSQWQKGEFEVVWPKARATAPLMVAKPAWV